MALLWNDGEGYDIHVLRGGSTSKPLDNALKRDPAGSLAFQPHFKGAPSSTGVNSLGVSVNTTTGVVTAHLVQGAPSFNFLMTARETVGTTTSETVIRIHIHDSVKKIWLTPALLPVHFDSPECRFTVLAMFDRHPDGVVGDITDWTVLTYSSFNKFHVDVNNHGNIFRGVPEPLGGRLLSRRPLDPDGPPDPDTSPVVPVDITVELKLSSPPTDLEHTAKAIPKPSWHVLGRDVTASVVKFVAGQMAPAPGQVDRTKTDSIEHVLENHVNVLFVSDGFLAQQEAKFREVVEKTVKQELLASDHLEPFRLLKDSVNYWSVFVPSDEEGITLLGDYAISGSPGKQVADEIPRARPPTSAQWSIENMIHAAGLPLPADPPLASSAAWVTDRSRLFAIPAGVSVDATALGAWNDLRKRSVLNERGSAFGMCHADRPQASGQRAAEERLLLDHRRTSPKSLQEFVTSLRFSNKVDMGTHWAHGIGKDFGLVCFVCQSSKLGGSFQNAPITAPGGGTAGGCAYFTAGTGLVAGAAVRPATNGIDLVPRPIDKSFGFTLYAALVAHEYGHALGLGDEYGEGAQYDPSLHGIPSDPNLQVETLLAPVNPSTSRRDFDASLIKWSWPRVTKARRLDGFPNLVGDPPQFPVPLLPGGGPSFARHDLARVREWPVRRHPSADPFAGIGLRVDSVTADTPTVSYVTPGGPHLDPNLVNSTKKYVLICTSVRPGVELPLVSSVIASQIDTSNSPLNAAKGSQGAPCAPGGGAKRVMTATNLPAGFRKPAGLASPADLIGVYEGGGYVECGIFRPAGRCRMRTGLDTTIPFCHVCRYLIVDAIDPAKHGELDSKMYSKQYP